MKAQTTQLSKSRRSNAALKVSDEPCGRSERCGVHGTGFGRIEGRAGTLAQLAAELSNLTRRTVLDQTGDDRHFNFTLSYTPDSLVMRPEVRAAFPGADPDGPALASALREQLGLRLQVGRAPTEVLVIDRLRRALTR